MARDDETDWDLDGVPLSDGMIDEIVASDAVGFSSPEELAVVKRLEEEALAAAFGPTPSPTNAATPNPYPGEDPAVVAAYQKGWGVRGNTYPVKDALKGIGCRWLQPVRTWVAMSTAMLAKADQIVKAGPALGATVPGSPIKTKFVAVQVTPPRAINEIDVPSKSWLVDAETVDLIREVVRRGFVVTERGETLAETLYAKEAEKSAEKLFELED